MTANDSDSRSDCGGLDGDGVPETARGARRYSLVDHGDPIGGGAHHTYHSLSFFVLSSFAGKACLSRARAVDKGQQEKNTKKKDREPFASHGQGKETQRANTVVANKEAVVNPLFYFCSCASWLPSSARPQRY
jgi:hypothetical protein